MCVLYDTRTPGLLMFAKSATTDKHGTDWLLGQIDQGRPLGTIPLDE